MLQKGEKVHVWNRAAAKAKALEGFGAKAFDNAYEAVGDADVIHVHETLTPVLLRGLKG